MFPLRSLLLVLALILGPMGAGAQPFDLKGILVVERDGLFSNSIYGQRILADIDRRTKALVEENRQIEITLIGEERALTDQRPSLAAAEFRELADAFDERVQRIRAEQKAKSDAIGEVLDEGRRGFFQDIIPILADIMRERGAAAILEKRTVLISISLIDITDEAVKRIDAQLGDGTGDGTGDETDEGASSPDPQQ